MLGEALIKLVSLLFDGRKVTFYNDGDIRFSKSGKKLPFKVVINEGTTKSNNRKYKEIYLEKR